MRPSFSGCSGSRRQTSLWRFMEVSAGICQFRAAVRFGRFLIDQALKPRNCSARSYSDSIGARSL